MPMKEASVSDWHWQKRFLSARMARYGLQTTGAGACFEIRLTATEVVFSFATVDIVICNMMAGGKNQMNDSNMRKVRKVYGSGNNQVTALDGIDLTISKGEFV